MILFCITELSDTLIDELISQNSRDEITVITDKPHIANTVQELGLHPLMLVELELDISERDGRFAEQMMPGMLDGLNIDSFPVWKSLALDRFKFWFSPSAKEHLEFINSLVFDSVFISLDLNSVYPWMCMNIADERDIDCVAIQTSSLKTKEFMAFTNYLSISDYIVETEEDASFLKRNGIAGWAIRTKRNQGGESPVEYPERTVLRNALGILENERVAGVFFDRRDEWHCRRWLEENVFAGKIFLFPVDPISASLLPDVLSQYMPAVMVYDDRKMLAACDIIVTFRYDETYCVGVPDGSDVKIVDYGGLNQSEVMVPHG